MSDALRTAARDDRLLAGYALAAHPTADYPLARLDGRRETRRPARPGAPRLPLRGPVRPVRPHEGMASAPAAFLFGLWTTHFPVDARRWTGPVGGLEAFSLRFDQTLHLLAIAVLRWLAETWCRG